MKTIHPAVAEHVMSENEKLRGALRKIVERCELFIDDEADMRTHSIEVLMGIASDALSQQAEPDGDGDHARRVLETLLGWQDEDWHWHFEQFPDLAERVRAQLPAKAEPAPAQDEREAFEECWSVRGTDDEGKPGKKPLRSLVDQQRYRGDAANGSWVWFQRGAAWQRTRPVQTEQRPVGYQFQDREGVWKQFMSERHYEDTLADGTWPIRAIYAAPIAQTAPQPEQSGLAERLNRVVAELKAGFVVCQRCGDQEDTATLDCVPELESITAALSSQGGDA